MDDKYHFTEAEFVKISNNINKFNTAVLKVNNRVNKKVSQECQFVDFYFKNFDSHAL